MLVNYLDTKEVRELYTRCQHQCELILQEWKKDAKIEEGELLNATLQINDLHVKYLNWKKMAYWNRNEVHGYVAQCRLLLMRYYSGELNDARTTLEMMGRKPIHYVIAKRDIDLYIEADSLYIDCVRLERAYDGMESLCDMILKQISGRNYQITNAIKLSQNLALPM